jgi:hypothetical protein
MSNLPANLLNSIEKYSQDHNMDFGKIAERLSIGLITSIYAAK